MEHDVDGDAVEETTAEPAPAPASPARASSGAELERRPASTEVLRPADAAQTAAAMAEYQAGLQSILDRSDWQVTKKNPDGTPKEQFVKKSGWRKIATWFNLSLELVSDSIERDERGDPLRATVWARAIAPNGRHADGDGHCAAAEKRFSGPNANRQKLENDLRATAATRATNRAIANLVGMGAVSAEEAEAGVAGDGDGPPWGPPADPKWATAFTKAVEYLAPDIGPNADQPNEKPAHQQLIDRVTTELGYIPQAAVRGVVELARLVRDAEKAEQGEGEEPPGADSAPSSEAAESEPAAAGEPESEAEYAAATEDPPDADVVDDAPPDDPGAPTSI